MNPPPSPPTPWHRLHLWEIQVVRDVLLITALLGVLWLGRQLQVITVPLLLGLGFAYLFEPIIHRASRVHPMLTRRRVVSATVLLLIIVLASVLSWAIPQALGQTRMLVQRLPHYIEQTIVWSEHVDVPQPLRDGIAALGRLSGNDTDHSGLTVERPAVATDVQDIGEIASGGRTLVRTVLRIISDLVAAGVSAFLLIVFFVVFSLSLPRVRHRLTELAPRTRGHRVRRLVNRMDAAVAGFIRGRLLICTILGAIYVVGWTLCGVPYALLLGTLTGVLVLIPYLSGISLPLAWILLTLHVLGPDTAPSFYLDAGGEPLWIRVLVLPGIVWTLAQLADDYLLTPWIQGRRTNMSPIMVMVAAIAGVLLAGLFGMLLAIPVAACLKIVVEEILLPHVRQWLRGERSDPLPLSGGTP